MPKLWNATIEGHRRSVTDAIIGTTAKIVAAHGLASVTMSRIAEEAGIGRATLYKYFSDVEGILVAWHRRQVHSHIEQLTAIRDQPGSAGERLEAVLQAYALITHEHLATPVSALLHHGEHVTRARQQLQAFIRDLLLEGARAGEFRDDVAADELAGYTLHALSAASSLTSKAAVRRLVKVTLDGLRAPR